MEEIKKLGEHTTSLLAKVGGPRTQPGASGGPNNVEGPWADHCLSTPAQHSLDSSEGESLVPDDQSPVSILSAAAEPALVWQPSCVQHSPASVSVPTVVEPIPLGLLVDQRREEDPEQTAATPAIGQILRRPGSDRGP